MIVIGAGIAGLALTRELYRGGIDAKTIEKREIASDSGLAINLPGNAMAALQQMGLRDAVAEIGYPTKRREYRTETGRLLFSVNETEFWGPDHQPRCILRSDLTRILRQDLPGYLFEFGREVSAVRQEKQIVTLSFSDGSKRTTDRLVGADGVNSTVRAKVFEQASQASLLSRFSWRFMANNPGIDCWSLWAGPTSMLLLIPVSNERVYVWATVSNRYINDDPTEFPIKHFEIFPSIARSIIDRVAVEPYQLHYSPLQEVRMQKWFNGQTLLIGDAAHGMAPVWAQGAALSIEDAVELANLLSRKLNWYDTLQQFEAKRRPRIEHVFRMTDKMSKAAQLPPVVRKFLLPVVGRRTYATTYKPLMAGTH